eukprot:jgi/Orpsp1_1/1189595/evm.model.d7180000073133.1
MKKMKMEIIQFLDATLRDNIEIVKLFIDYANQHDIILELNEKNNIGYYPLLWVTIKNDIEMIKLLIEYANKYNIILQLNKKNQNGSFPLSEAIDNDNIEIIKLLIEYANQHNITLELNEYDFVFYSNINEEIIKLLFKYEKEHLINIKYKMNGRFLSIKDDQEYENKINIFNNSNIQSPIIPEEKELFINNIISKIENDYCYKICNENYFEWKIYNWNKVKNNSLIYSNHYKLGKYLWKIELCKYENHVSLYLNCINGFGNIYTNFVFSMNNYYKYSINKSK